MLRRFFPRKAAGPTCQEQHVGFGQGSLAIAPGTFFHDDSVTAAAIHAPHRVQKEDKESPERDKLKAPLAELVVTARRLVAARADRGRARALPHEDFDALVVRAECGAMIDKPPEAVATVQNRDQFHGADGSGSEPLP